MSPVAIRPMESRAERDACVALQEQTWGDGFADRVPASILMVAEKTGGIALGAFDADVLVGFVFGITGFRDGAPLHWSDMLAVAPTHRNRGIGTRLKLAQRDALLRAGVTRMVWTFDPLEARNAHLNLDRLGAVSRTYHRDLYGDSTSPLHAGIGTDRLLVEWELDSERVRSRLDPGHARPAASASAADAESGARGVDTPSSEEAKGAVLNPWRPGDPHPVPDGEPGVPRQPTVRVAIPVDIQGMKRDDPELARAWRASVRAALESCFGAGYTAVGTARGPVVSSYVLTRGLTR